MGIIKKKVETTQDVTVCDLCGEEVNKRINILTTNQENHLFDICDKCSIGLRIILKDKDLTEKEAFIANTCVNRVKNHISDFEYTPPELKHSQVDKELFKAIYKRKK